MSANPPGQPPFDPPQPPPDWQTWPLADKLRLHWTLQARPNQLTPEGPWNIWLVMAGRGWGKTRVGAEDVLHYGLKHPGSRLAILAPTFADARDTCIEGASGLLGLIPRNLSRKWNRSLGELQLANGTLYKLFSAEEPERLRGPNFHRAWVDELGVVAQQAPEAWDQLQFGLRLGDHPQIVATTTPRPTPLIRALLDRGDVVLTRGRTMENADHLAPSALAALRERYAGTRLGRQELDGELLEEVEGALWSREIFEDPAFRVDPTRVPPLTRIVVALDPADGIMDDEDHTKILNRDEQGICVAGIDAEGRSYVLASEGLRTSPTRWLHRAFALAQEYRADALVYEKNHGGKFLATLIQQTMAREGVMIRLREVTASVGKMTRAEPVAGAYEQRRVHHVGRFDRLEDQMATYTGDPRQKSPDLLDAMVWALSELGTGRRVRIVV